MFLALPHLSRGRHRRQCPHPRQLESRRVCVHAPQGEKDYENGEVASAHTPSPPKVSGCLVAPTVGFYLAPRRSAIYGD